MKLTKVEASSLQEALRKIRATLGDDAEIVGTRSFRRGGVLGLGGQEVVEVYVTDPRPAGRPAPPRAAPYPPPGPAETPAASTASLSPAALLAASAAARRGQAGLDPAALTALLGAVPAAAAGSLEIQTLSRALGQLREEIRGLIKEKEEPPDHPFLQDACALLVEREVDPKLAARIVGQMRSLPLPAGLPDPSRVRAVVTAVLRRLFPASLPPAAEKLPRVVVLVGPTGVGKTTTIAKLAARAKLAEGRRVGLITLDTFRIAAVDQLEKYARIIGVPLAVATDPVEFAAALRTFEREGLEAVFVDSAGRSQRDELKMGELREFLGAAPGAEVHLVLSTTTHPRTLRSVADRFASAGYQRVILTKLDETSGLGSLLECAAGAGEAGLLPHGWTERARRTSCRAIRIASPIWSSGR